MGEERLILPPPLQRRRESEILNELPNVLGLVLWQDVRHLHAWVEASSAVRPQRRARPGIPRARPDPQPGSVPISRPSPKDFFNPSPPPWVIAKRRDARAQCGELAPALDEFWAVVASPLSVDRAAVAGGCRQVVEWALAHEHTQTAIEFAEAAALVAPEDPAMANLAGRVTRNAGEHARAEVWFNRSIGYSREHAHGIELTRAHLGKGILCQELGRVRCAMHHFNIGSRKARKQGIEWLAAEVQHDVMLLLTVRGRYGEALKHAGLALRWYGKRHERFPLFAADVALLLVLERNYSLAARISKAALRHVANPTARSVILSLHARALAGVGMVDELGRLRKRVLRLLEDYHEKEPVALWHLAAAERLARRWETAAATAERALELAKTRGDRETEMLTNRLLIAIRTRKPAPPLSSPRRDGEFIEFVQTLNARLAAWSPEQRTHSELRAKWAA
jgi:tetratricopeptide (TPR) repeat protein